jgi:integrase
MRRPDGSPVGIQRTPFGWRACIRVRGVLYSKRFPPTATLTKMRDWRSAKRVDVLRSGPPRRNTKTFSEDVDEYLKAVKAMPTYAAREADMDRWLTELGGDRTRDTITSVEIRAVLQRWRMTGRTTPPGPLSESACNHRRTALQHFFTVMNGKAAANPVRDVPRFREPDPQPRGVPFETLQRVFAAMPDSKTKARALVMALTGLPPATLKRIEPGALNVEAKSIIVPRRRKGAGTKTRNMPLTDEAIAAFQMLDGFEGWGHFSSHSARHSLHRACDAAGVPRIRLYDLRHSFGTAAYLATGDIRAVQALLDHCDPTLTARYTLAAVDPRMRAALNRMPALMPRADAKEAS